MSTTHPIPDSYWVIPGRLLAGEYPGHPDDTRARQKLGLLLEAGITLFFDLTEPGEYGLRPYAQLLAELAAPRGQRCEHRRFPIPDFGTVAPHALAELLADIDAALEAGHRPYVHCYGGIGRTGTVVGCYLVEHGLSSADALATIARLRADTPDGIRQSPETAAQRAMVHAWQSRHGRLE